MLQDSLILLGTFCILMLPLVFWMYIFVSFFPTGVSRIHFLIGVFLGGFLTSIFIFHESLFQGQLFGNIFIALAQMDTASFVFKYFFYVLLFMSFLSVIFSIGSVLYLSSFQKLLQRNVLSYLFCIFLLLGVTGSILLIHRFTFKEISGITAQFGDIIFSSLGAIITYYITISFLEETGKYIAQSGFSGRKETQVFHGFMAVSASVALGFAFFENIFYSYQYISTAGISGDLFSFIIVRSIFSTTLHIVSSLLLSFSFWLLFQSVFQGPFQKRNIILFSFLSLLLHTCFNLSLTFGFIGFLFLMLIGTYIVLSFMMQKQQEYL